MRRKPKRKYKRRMKVMKPVMEKRGTITTLCLEDTKKIEVDGVVYTLPREFFEGFMGHKRVFSLNHPIAYASIIGVLWAIAIVSIVGIIFAICLIGFSRGGANVFGLSGGQGARYQGDGRNGN